MAVNSLLFVCFLAAVTLIYYGVPIRWRNAVLLFSSYLFYLFAGLESVIVVLAMTVISYVMAFWLHHSARYKKAILSFSIVMLVLLLAVFKFTPKIMTSASDDGSLWLLGVVIPMGISFYTLQAIGYLIDLYRGKVEFEKDFVIYALFMSFFAYAVSGPIERAEHMFSQYKNKHSFDYTRVCHGAQLFLWGVCVKLILADRLGIIARELLSQPKKYIGWQLVLGGVLYSLQIYCDFAGYSDMARGVARILGFDIMSNFERPYFAESISEFWARWHISLSKWLRDYIYIPLGGNRKGVLRKRFNLFVVFLVSGIWHGTGWNFIVWGMLYVVYYLGSDLLAPARNWLVNSLHINREIWEWKMLQRFLTFSLVTFAWIFFFASDVGNALEILQGMTAKNNIGVLFANGAFNVAGMVQKDWIVIWVAFLILLIVDILRERGINIFVLVDRRPLITRWIIYIGMITAVAVFGIYGPGYSEASFIYEAF